MTLLSFFTAYRSFGRFWQARHPPRYATFLRPPSPRFGHSSIVEALDSSLATVARTRQRLVEEGFDAVLTRKHSPNSARKRVFDGAAEAKLIALACSEPPKGRSRWTLALLEDKVVELKIVERASDNTIGRVLKKTFSNRT